MYQVQWLDDIPEGNGAFIVKKESNPKEDLFQYDGTWKHGRRSGNGNLAMNGSTYKVLFHQDLEVLTELLGSMEQQC